MSFIELDKGQRKALEKMKCGCILCGGVGSGKSRTALAYYYIKNGGNLDTERYSKMKDPLDLYIITTAKKRDELDWEEEMLPFRLSKNSDVNLYSNKVVVDSWNNITKYAKVKDSFFIFDEQRVIGYGKWVQAFLKIAKVNHWILLSATPGDTWSDYIPVFIANGFFKNKTEFVREHVVYSRLCKYPKIERYLSTWRLQKYRDEILVTIDYVSEATSHDLDIWVNYDRDAYKQIVRYRFDFFNNKPIKTASEYCFLLRKVVNTSPTRELAILEILEKHDRVIIFYSFDYELDILRKIYYGPEYEVAEWNGHYHQPIPDSKKWIYLVQYTSGAEGWNCISTNAIIFYSQTYSYKVLKQSKGRIDRRNTKFKDLYYYHLKSKAPIDLAIERALNNKKIFSEKRFFTV